MVGGDGEEKVDSRRVDHLEWMGGYQLVFGWKSHSGFAWNYRSSSPIPNSSGFSTAALEIAVPTTTRYYHLPGHLRLTT